MLTRLTVVMVLAAAWIAPVQAQAPSAREAQTSPQILQPVQPPEATKAPADLRSPEEPNAAKEENPRANRTDPAMVHSGSGTTVPARECNECKRIRGLVLAAQEDGILIIRDRSKKEIRITMDADTIKGLEESRFTGYVEGDRIEAYVKPDGKVHSINLWKAPAGMPGPDDISGG